MYLKKYRKKSGQTVLAIQIDLDTDGFSYRKWEDIQRCKAGDWLVNNNGDTYTVDRQVFAETYRKVSPGSYRKVKPVWARLAEEDGRCEAVCSFCGNRYFYEAHELSGEHATGP